MKSSVIVTGASGRMGSTVARLIDDHPRHELVGLTEREGVPISYSADLRINDLPKFLKDFRVEGLDTLTIIDFTAPERTLEVAKACVGADDMCYHLITGTTGFTPEQMTELKSLQDEVAIFHSPNMSLGVNVLARFLPLLTNVLGEEFNLEMVELHHNMKKDAPSGTALMLANAMAEARGWSPEDVLKFAREGMIGERPKEEIGIQTIRGGDVVGEHTAYFFGPGERVAVTHMAHSRETFAAGAIRLIDWFTEYPNGFLTMDDYMKRLFERHL